MSIDPQNISELAKLIDKHSDRELLERAIACPELQVVLHRDLRERYVRNMEIFKQYLPHIYEQFKDYKFTKEYEFLCTESGIPNLYDVELQRFFYKALDPLALCKEQVELCLKHAPFDQTTFDFEDNEQANLQTRYLNEVVQLVVDYAEPKLRYQKLGETNSMACSIVLGCGLGYSVGILYERIEIANLIVIEPDSDLFFASLHSYDWANLLNFAVQEGRGIYFMVGQNSTQVLQDINAYFDHHGRMLAAASVPLKFYESPKVNELAGELSSRLSFVYSSLGIFDDYLYASAHGIQYIQEQIPFFKTQAKLPESICGIPLCVVANGPSLSNDLAMLRKVQDKVIIVACGSAIDTLYQAGIQAHIYVCTERLGLVADTLTPIAHSKYLEEVLCIGTEVLHPNVTKLFKHKAFFLKSEEHIDKVLGVHANKLQDLRYSYLINPLVGNFGVTLGYLLEFKQVYLFGVDNGTVREDGMLHPDESHIYSSTTQEDSFEVTKNINENKQILEAEGNFGKRVLTNELYSHSAQVMEIVIERARELGVSYFNCSDGLKINGAIPLHSSEVQEVFLSRSALDREELFKAFADITRPIDLHLSIEEIERLMEKKAFNKIADLLKEQMLCRTSKQIKSRLDFILHMEQVCELLYKISSSTQYSFLSQMLSCTLNCIFITCTRILYKISDESKAIRIAYRGLELAGYFLDDAKRYYAFMPDFIQRDGQEKHLTNIGFDHKGSKAPPMNKTMHLKLEKSKDFVKRYE